MLGVVESPVDSTPSGRRFVEREAFELAGQLVDLPLELARVQGVSGPAERAALAGGEDPGGDSPLEWGGGLVVALDDLGTHPGAAEELLLGEHQVGETPVELPDPVERRELGGGVEAQV